MVLNLISSAWIPVRRRDETRLIAKPAQIVEHLGTGQEIMTPDWPRTDLNVATCEFLIGLLSVAMPPERLEDWSEVWANPPDAKALDKALAPYIPAFNLDGPGPRFMQDFEDLQGDPGNLEALFIDSAGENAVRKNADLMVKRQRYSRLSRSAAAIALYALQQFAPAGGAGHRTSMRGGGPLTTLAMPPATQGAAPSLWSLIWANILPNDNGPLPPQEFPKTFPWMAATMTSEKGMEIHQADQRAHPLQAFFGMPRRVRLVFEENAGQQPCDLTGEADSTLATAYITRPYGINYGQWRHPLTPYYRKKADDSDSFATHPAAGRQGYRNWLSLTLGDGEKKTRDPAACIINYRQNYDYDAGGAKILIAGWAMNNMKPLDYAYAEQPLHRAASEDHREKLDQLARVMVSAADSACGFLIGAIQDALKAGGNKPKHDTSLITASRESFFADTEQHFHELLGEASKRTEIPDDWGRDLKESWLKTLQQKVFTLFDATVQPDPFDPQRAKQIVRAREKLTRNLLSSKSQKSLRGLLYLPIKTSTKGKKA